MLATWTGVLKDGHVCVHTGICSVKSKPHTGGTSGPRVYTVTGLCGNYVPVAAKQHETREYAREGGL
jgi:hypothetical protein